MLHALKIGIGQDYSSDPEYTWCLVSVSILIVCAVHAGIHADISDFVLIQKTVHKNVDCRNEHKKNKESSGAPKIVLLLFCEFVMVCK